ncbi:MAG: hypothetical protein GY705_23200 [Bacteroidetes bacterium]|nr:hypothetical protein [Bacteroidota bacterium]
MIQSLGKQSLGKANAVDTAITNAAETTASAIAHATTATAALTATTTMEFFLSFSATATAFTFCLNVSFNNLIDLLFGETIEYGMQRNHSMYSLD